MKGFRVLSLDYMIGKYGIIIIWQKINGVKIKGLRFWSEKKVLNLLVGKYKVSIFAVPKLRRGGRGEMSFLFWEKDL